MDFHQWCCCDEKYCLFSWVFQNIHLMPSKKWMHCLMIQLFLELFLVKSFQILICLSIAVVWTICRLTHQVSSHRNLWVFVCYLDLGPVDNHSDTPLCVLKCYAQIQSRCCTFQLIYVTMCLYITIFSLVNWIFLPRKMMFVSPAVFSYGRTNGWFVLPH